MGVWSSIRTQILDAELSCVVEFPNFLLIMFDSLLIFCYRVSHTRNLWLWADLPKELVLAGKMGTRRPMAGTSLHKSPCGKGRCSYLSDFCHLFLCPCCRHEWETKAWWVCAKPVFPPVVDLFVLFCLLSASHWCRLIYVTEHESY